VFLALLVARPSAGQAPAEPPDFSGSWRLDPRRSDGPEGTERREAERSPGDDDRQREGGSPAGGSGRRTFDADAERAERAARAAAFASLEIRRGDGEAWIVRDGSGAEHTLVPDGVERRVVEPDGREAWWRCEWRDGDRLFSRRVQAAVAALEESYELSPDGATLTVRWKLVGGPRQGRESVRTYLRAADGRAAAPPGAARPTPRRAPRAEGGRRAS